LKREPGGSSIHALSVYNEIVKRFPEPGLLYGDARDSTARQSPRWSLDEK
jgi:hypothetical protein